MPTMNSVSLVAGSISQGVRESVFAHPTWDIIMIVVFLAAAFFYAIIAGKGRIVTGIIVSYVAVSLWHVLPMDSIVDNIGDGERFAVKITLFFALFIALYALVSRSSVIAQVRSSARDKLSALTKTFVLAALQVGMFLNIIFSFLLGKRNL